MFVHVDKKNLLLDFDHFLCFVVPPLGIIHVRIVVGFVSFYHTDPLSQICIPGFSIVMDNDGGNVRDRIYIFLVGYFTPEYSIAF